MVTGWMVQFFIFPDFGFVIQYTIKDIIFTGECTSYRYNRMYAAIVKQELLTINIEN